MHLTPPRFPSFVRSAGAVAALQRGRRRLHGGDRRLGLAELRRAEPRPGRPEGFVWRKESVRRSWRDGRAHRTPEPPNNPEAEFSENKSQLSAGAHLTVIRVLTSHHVAKTSARAHWFRESVKTHFGPSPARLTRTANRATAWRSCPCRRRRCRGLASAAALRP